MHETDEPPERGWQVSRRVEKCNSCVSLHALAGSSGCQDCGARSRSAVDENEVPSRAALVQCLARGCSGYRGAAVRTPLPWLLCIQ